MIVIGYGRCSTAEQASNLTICVRDQSNLSSDRETEGYGSERQHQTSAGTGGVDVLLSSRASEPGCPAVRLG
jgi:hypothetical protein